MHITLIVVGKLKERYWRDACAEYIKRLSAVAKITLLELPDIDSARVGGVGCAIQKECDHIVSVLPDNAYCVLCDIQGTLVSSEEIAELISSQQVHGHSHFVFIVGGSYGVNEQVKQLADMRMSLGRITLPHNLARVVVLEQLYRAHRIIAGAPYHK